MFLYPPQTVFVGGYTVFTLADSVSETFYYAPNFEEVEEAYWFGPVHLSVCLSIRPSVYPSVRYTCTRSRTARDRILKFGMWVEHEN